MSAVHVAILASPAAVFVADATNAWSDPAGLIGTFITPVIVVLLLVTDRLHTHGDYVRLLGDRDAEREERKRLQTAMNDRAIPALTRSTLALEAALPRLGREVRLHAARDDDTANAFGDGV